MGGIPAGIVAGRNPVEERHIVVEVRRSICRVVSEKCCEKLSECAVIEGIVAFVLSRLTLAVAAEERRSILERPFRDDRCDRRPLLL